MKRCSFMLVLAAGGAVIALPGCGTLAASATAPWADPGTSDTDPRLRALAWALWAPNPHNLQSWVAESTDPMRAGTAAAAALASSVFATRHTRAWLSSADNSRSSQIEAGRAYLRVDLTAAQLGLAIHPNSQVPQASAAMSALYCQFHAGIGVVQPARVQMLVRLGYVPRPEPAPRRPRVQLVRA